MEESLIYNVFRNTNTSLSKEDINMLSPLQLAFVGDAVYELLVRTFLIKNGLKVNELHKETIKYVKAKAQSNIVHLLEGILTDGEIYYVKKGRNTKTNSSPKNAEMIDYKYATGFECLLGYLYLTGQDIRLGELFENIANLEI